MGEGGNGDNCRLVLEGRVQFWRIMSAICHAAVGALFSVFCKQARYLHCSTADLCCVGRENVGVPQLAAKFPSIFTLQHKQVCCQAGVQRLWVLQI